jgi:hypothetical protein
MQKKMAKKKLWRFQRAAIFVGGHRIDLRHRFLRQLCPPLREQRSDKSVDVMTE